MDYDKTDKEIQKEELRILHRKPGLATSTRYLASIEALIALGKERLLHAIFELALEEEVDLIHIHEAMLQACIFCGFPRTINAFAVLRRYLLERGNGLDEKSPPLLDERSAEQMDVMGVNLFRTIYQYNHFEVLKALEMDHPELPGWVIRDVYGKVLTRPALEPKERELAAVAALTVSRVYPQLLSHIKGGLNLGADKSEVKEVILQMEAYVPKEIVRRALRILNLGTRPRKPSVKKPSVPEAS